jgi:hypothetical protein
MMNVEQFALVTNASARTGKEAVLHNARDFVEKNIETADDIVIVSGFYGEEFIKAVLRKSKFSGRGRRLTFVFAGLPDVVRDKQVDDLKTLKDHIVSTHGCAAKNVDIRLATNSKFLHAKVFRFQTKNGLPVYVIGSANFSAAAFSQNDEAMVVIKGPHPGLNDYIRHVVETSQSINKRSSNVPAHNWRDFLRNGFLYFRPSRAIAYTIDPFADDEFTQIAARLREQILNPLPFSDRNVLGLNLAALLDLGPPEKNTKLGFRLPTYAIETDYGYWVPEKYVDYIEKKLEKALEPKRRALRERGAELEQAGDNYVNAQIKVYLDEVERRIATGGEPLTLTRPQKAAINEKIVRRVRHLKALLTHPKALERLAQTLVGAPVPEFWEDEASVSRFFEGFCYDILAKLSSPGSTPKIVAHLANQFDIREGDDIKTCQEKIEGFFSQDKSWSRNNWPTLPDEK